MNISSFVFSDWFFFLDIILIIFLFISLGWIIGRRYEQIRQIKVLKGESEK